jgi:hypothetical protein
MPFTELPSQLIVWPEDLIASWQVGIIDIELTIQSFEIMAWDAESGSHAAVARDGLRRAGKLRGHRWKRQAAGSRH